MIRVRTGSRLHFGLFSLPSEHAGPWLNQEGEPTLPRRNFGGIGLMIEKPGVEIGVERATSWSAEGPLAARALEFAQTYSRLVGPRDTFHVRVESAAPQHSGLGTGTQLGLAVARALAEFAGNPTKDLAVCLGRGNRSAIGAHGFQSGGFLVEGGKASDTKLSPLLIRRDFPEEWRILLIIPKGFKGTHGRQEINAFTTLARHHTDERTTEALCRLVLTGLLPALVERDLPTFGEALYDFNRRVGEMFRLAQGGVYAHSRGGEIVSALRRAGIQGVGQSSWGPTIFAIVNTDHAPAVRDRLVFENVIAPEESIITWAYNHGARLRHDA